MVKIVIDAGHGYNTPGKRTPDGEREWSFNNKVALGTIVKLNTYQNVQILRVDDPTGNTDVPLRTRTDRANNWDADVYVSIHHNALTGIWGKHSGIETFTMNHPQANPKSMEVAKAIHSRILKAMGLQDRGIKKMNLHVLRETRMPAILTEGGFMDSTVDIAALRTDTRLKAQGELIAEGLAAYFKLHPKNEAMVSASPEEIKKLQSMLNKVGFSLGVDGVLSKSTLNAIQMFQRRAGLTVDGIAGVKTMAVLKETLAKNNAPKEDVKLPEYKKDAQPSKLLAPEFAKAVKAGITDGTYPQRPATREEVAVMVLRGLNLKN